MHRGVNSTQAAALILGVAALLSKFLGLIRDRLLAGTFGAGDALDVYYAAFQIPDILFTFFLVGAASAAVLPVFLERERASPEDAEKFVSNLLTVFGVLSSALVLVALILAPWITGFVAPGFGAVKLAQTVALTRLMMLNAVFLGIAGIFSSVLQARHRFFVFALPPIVYNLGIISGIVFFAPVFGVKGLAYGVLLGGMTQVLVLWPALRAMNFNIRPRFDLSDGGLRRVVRVSMPRVAALSMSQLTLVALGAMASFFSSGSISVFKLASNLIYVPVGLFGVSWALAAFPKLSSAFMAGRPRAFREQMAVGFKNILFWSLPFAVLFVVLRAHLVRVLLGSGVFDWEDTRLVAAVLAVLSAAIVSESILPLILRAFYALGRTLEPLVWDVVGSASSILMALGFSVLFRARPEILSGIAEALRIGDIQHPDILGVAMAFAIGSILNAVLLGLALRRVSKEKLRIDVSLGFGSLAAMLGASVLAGLAAYVTLLPFPSILATNTVIGIFLQGAVAGAAGLSVYAAALIFLKNPEALGLVRGFRKRLFNLKKTPQIFETEKLNGESGK